MPEAVSAFVGGRVNGPSGRGGLAHRASREVYEFREHGFAGIDKVLESDTARPGRAITRQQGNVDECGEARAVLASRRLDRAPAEIIAEIGAGIARGAR